MGTRIVIGESEFELNFDLTAEDPLPPGVERLEDENGWPDGTPAEIVAYAQELAISREQVAHWVNFFSAHPHGRQAWETIRQLWKPPRRRPARTSARKR